MTRGETGGHKTGVDWRQDEGPALRTVSHTDDFTGTDPETGLVYGVYGPDQIGLAPWRTLNTFALTPSPFYDPVFLRAISGFGGGDMHVMVVREAGDNGGLKAIWPYTEVKLGPVSSLKANATFSTHYSPTSVPIVARGEAEATIATALRGFARLAPVLVVPNLPLESDFGKALFKTLGSTGFAHTVTGKHGRTAFKGPAIYKDYVDSHWSANRRHQLRKAFRKLEAAGHAHYRIASVAAPWDGVAEAFLALENRGWKGRAGTAMAAQQESRRIVHDVVNRLIPAGLAEIHALMLGDEPVAMLILLRLRGHVMAWKIAYDEDWSHASPGHLIFAEATRKIIARGDHFADSCATDDVSVADSYWYDQVPFGMMHIGLKPGASGMLGLGLSAAQASAFDIARNTYRAIRRHR